MQAGSRAITKMFTIVLCKPTQKDEAVHRLAAVHLAHQHGNAPTKSPPNAAVLVSQDGKAVFHAYVFMFAFDPNARACILRYEDDYVRMGEF